MECIPMNKKIARGTTPTIKFKFRSIDTSDIEVAYLVFKQSNRQIFNIDISGAEIEEGYISWVVPQEKSLMLSEGKFVDIYCDWRTINGLRGQSKLYRCEVVPSGIDEVI